jgi:hypothetical protein
MKRPVPTGVLWLAMLVAGLLGHVRMAQTQGSYPRTIADNKGHTVTLAAKPTRIASVVLGVDENLVDMADPARIVAMTELSRLADVSNIADRVPAGKTFVTVSHHVVKVVTDVQTLVAAAPWADVGLSS